MKHYEFMRAALDPQDTINMDYWSLDIYTRTLYNLIVDDVLKVVAAQALLNENAMDVYINLKNLYKE